MYQAPEEEAAQPAVVFLGEEAERRVAGPAAPRRTVWLPRRPRLELGPDRGLARTHSGHTYTCVPGQREIDSVDNKHTYTRNARGRPDWGPP